MEVGGGQVDMKIDTVELRGSKGVLVCAQYQNPGRQSPFLGRWIVFHLSSYIASFDFLPTAP